MPKRRIPYVKYVVGSYYTAKHVSALLASCIHLISVSFKTMDLTQNDLHLIPSCQRCCDLVFSDSFDIFLFLYILNLGLFSLMFSSLHIFFKQKLA